jgi:hypothetical protein
MKLISVDSKLMHFFTRWVQSDPDAEKLATFSETKGPLMDDHNSAFVRLFYKGEV